MSSALLVCWPAVGELDVLSVKQTMGGKGGCGEKGICSHSIHQQEDPFERGTGHPACAPAHTGSMIQTASCENASSETAPFVQSQTAARLISAVPLCHLVTSSHTRKILLLLVCVPRGFLSATLQPAFSSRLCNPPIQATGEMFSEPLGQYFPLVVPMLLFPCCYPYSFAPTYPGSLAVVGCYGQQLPPARESTFFPPAFATFWL